MIIRILIAAASLVSLAHAADFDRTLTVSASPDLYVSTGSGNVHIHAGNGSEVRIHAHIHPGWNAGSDLNDRIARISANPPIQQSGDSIHIGEVRPEDRHLYNNISIDYDITAPRQVALNLRSGSGDLEIDQLGRFLKAQTGSGSIRAHGIAGVPPMLQLAQVTLSWSRALPVKFASPRVPAPSACIALTVPSPQKPALETSRLTALSLALLASPPALAPIRLHIGRDARYNVEATTGSGSLRIAGIQQAEHHHVSEPVNGGGPTLEAHTGSGDVEID